MFTEPFPHFLLIKASAGTGKTYLLSKRIARFLLSDRVPFNELRNILAITFTVNAAREMKGRVLDWLKKIAFGDEKSIIEMFGEFEEKHPQRAHKLVQNVISNYSDFQIKTIDSFLASLFKASSYDFGFNPDFEILIDNRELMELSFNSYLKDIDEKSYDIIEIIDFINEGSKNFKFDVVKDIFTKIKDLYKKQKNYSGGILNRLEEDRWRELIIEANDLVREIEELISKNNFKISGNSGYKNIKNDLKGENFKNLFSHGTKNPPVSNVKDKNDDYYEILEKWEELKVRIGKMAELFSERYYHPYLNVLNNFGIVLDNYKKREGKIFIEDIPSMLLESLDISSIPDVYLKLGGRLYHFFIDEFQDTSEVQWKNLSLLIEESLSKGGSLFIVGDTKQAIYGFRDTDYKIMKRLSEENIFSSCRDSFFVESLSKNYRSKENILIYTKEVFQKVKNSENEELKAGEKSGLFSWEIDVKEENRDKGYVKANVVLLDETKAEKEVLKETIEDLVSRGYKKRDIAILAHKNDQIVNISSWLNEFGYPILSYSSLDIRERKIIQEIIFLLRFLDKPLDDFSFSIFLLSDIFKKLKPAFHVQKFLIENRENKPYYLSFKDNFNDIWDSLFKDPLRLVGYLPLYELTAFIFNHFSIPKNFPEEEGALAKFLEIIKDLESKGKNSLKEFIQFMEDREENEYEDNRAFNLPIPQNIDAIKVMTIHKAKGLGFPVVIFLYYDQRKNKSENIKIVREDRGIKILNIDEKMANKSPLLKKYYEYYKEENLVNDLNSLYVALTRAEEEMYVLSIKKDLNREEEKLIDLLPQLELGEKLIKQWEREEEKVEVANTKVVLSPKLKISEDSISSLAYAERRRGDFIHLILSKIDSLSNKNLDNIKGLVRDIAPLFCDLPIKEDLICQGIVDFIFHEGIRVFFETKGKEVFVEKEFVDKEGRIAKIDRLIIGENGISVIDFKTGDIEEGYTQQIRRYVEIIKDIYPDKKIEGYILYFDKKRIEKVYEL